MKILHTVQRYYPDSGGSEEVVKQISEYLVSKGHNVTVMTGKSPNRNYSHYKGVRIIDFDIKGNNVDGIRGEVSEFKKFIKSENFDIVMNYAAQIWSTDLFFEMLSEIKAKKVLVPCGYSALRNPKYSEYFSQLPQILRQYDAVVYLSPNYIDTKFGEQNNLSNGTIIPNAADENEFNNVSYGAFKKNYNIPHKNLIINVSNHSLLKGHKFFWNCIAQLKNDDICGALIGNPYFSGAKKWLKECYLECKIQGVRFNRAMFENLPRRDVVSAYIDADIFILGSQVECSPLVMFESFASKTLFVTTNCGNVNDYSDIVCLVENESEAVSVVNKYLKDKQQFQERIERGYHLFKTSLNWKAVSEQYEQLYLSLLGN
jgi:L-malate glycosyltransferase